VTNTRLQLPTAHCYLASSSFGTGPLSSSDPRT